MNAHAAWRAVASLAVQLTDVVPSGKDDPELCVHVTFTGAAPPVTVGAGNVTGCSLPVMPGTVRSAGHAICGAVVVGPIGPFDPQAASSSVAAPNQPRRIIEVRRWRRPMSGAPSP